MSKRIKEINAWGYWPVVISLAFILVCSCSKTTTKPDVDGQTHWLKKCSDDDQCGGLSCICNICTEICESDSECKGIFSKATCVARDKNSDALNCSSFDPAKDSLCDFRCKKDSDCAKLNKDLSCNNGYCREKGFIVDETGDAGAAKLSNVERPTEPPDAAVRNDTKPCDGKSSNDPCRSTVVTSSYCSKGGSAVLSKGACDEGGIDGALYCLPEENYCSINYALFCQNDSQKGDQLLVERFACNQDDPSDVKCVADREEISQNCNDRIGDTFCGTGADKEKILEVTAMNCTGTEYGDRCVITQSRVIADCSLDEKRCDEKVERQPPFSLDELFEGPVSNLLNTIISRQTATCIEPEPCYGAKEGDPCHTGRAQCSWDNQSLYKETGACSYSEMVLTCFGDNEECPTACVDNENGPHCE